MKIFVDQSAWLSFMNPNDPMHIPLKDEFQVHLDEDDRFYTTNVLVGKVISELKSIRSAEKAIQFYDVIEEAWLGTHLHILWIGRRTFKDATKLFRKHPDSSLGLFDFANIILMNRRNIRSILTTNMAYREMGFRLLPEKIG